MALNKEYFCENPLCSRHIIVSERAIKHGFIYEKVKPNKVEFNRRIKRSHYYLTKPPAIIAFCEICSKAIDMVQKRK